MVADEAHEGVDTNEENDVEPSDEEDHRSQGRGRQLYVLELGFAAFFMHNRNTPDQKRKTTLCLGIRIYGFLHAR